MIHTVPTKRGLREKQCHPSRSPVWVQIYSESDEVNGVQMDIRTGHQVTIDTVLAWVDETPDKLKVKPRGPWA